MALKTEEYLYVRYVCVNLGIRVSYMLTVCMYLHVGNQTCYAYALSAPPRQATFAFTLFSGTGLNASAKGFSVRPAPLWPPALEMGYFWQRCRVEPLGGRWPQGSRQKRMGHFSTTDTGNPFQSPFRRNSQRRPPSPQTPPALSA